MNVSVIIPAYNAAGTLAETLESILKQTFRNLEVIVIDNGSNDETATVAATFAEKDHRIRVVSEPQKGVSIARNTGIRMARFDWLLFLDADDWLLPQHLERMTSVLISDPSLDAVQCGWARVTPDGKRVGEHFWPESGNLFPAFTYTCAFCIHACVVRRSIVESLGGFDTSLITCEDWDLWQRIARTGARFGEIHEVLSLYRMRQTSASNNGFRIFTDGLRVIERGHSPDTRVPNPLPENANGQPPSLIPSRKFYFTCWSAGLVLGRGEDARPLLNALNGVHYPGLDPTNVASCLFESALLPTCQTPDAWEKIWPGIEQRVEEFFFDLENHTKISGLARRAGMALKRMSLEHSTIPRPFTNGTIYAVRVEITESICDIIPPIPVERLNCNVEIEGTHIGIIELPVCDGIVPAYVLADAIAAEFAWPIIGKFFERTIYPNLTIKQEPSGFSIWRGNLRLTEILTRDEQGVRQQMHKRIGWTIFLQEIWGCKELPSNSFYEAYWKLSLKEVGWKVFLRETGKRRIQSFLHFFKATKIGQRIINDGWITVDVCDPLSDVKVSDKKIDVLLTVGGIAIGSVTVPVKQNIVHARELRMALTKASGFELFRAAVREGVIGRPLTDKPSSLRARLEAIRCSVAQRSSDTASLELCDDFIFAPGSENALDRALSPGDHGLILGRHAGGKIATSVSRRAALPASTTSALIDAAQVADEPVILIPREGKQPMRVIYAPDLIWRSSLQGRESIVGENTSQTVESCDTPVYGHDYFEKVFAARPDPWKYTSPYEQKKYEQTLEMLPPGRIGRALELACAEGHFTVKLASRVDNLVAADISQTALGRAAKRCANMKNFRFVQLDLTKDPLPGRFELIVCSEVLYYVGGRKELEVIAHKLANALEPEGYLLTAHAHVVEDDPDHTGFDRGLQFGAKVISETFMSIRNLRLVKEIRTPLYRIQLFQRSDRKLSHFLHGTPEILELTHQPTPLLPKVEAYARWRSGGHPRSSTQKNIVTDRLPILMYHRVAPTGILSTARYRVTPAMFEEQLRYLRDAGYYSINLEDWRNAMERKRPIHGRAVMLTFDDGFLDFLTYAWPLLKQYGFLATVFLVTDSVGRINSWDSVYGEAIPLLGWDDIRQLQDEGVEFGSHTVSHPFLRSLSAENIVLEGARSLATIGHALGITVKSFAYPYGDVDQVVQHLIGACGYTFGLSCRHDLCNFYDNLLALPRIEVVGTDSLQDFIEKLRV